MINCTFEDGGSAGLRHVTVNAIVVKDNKILLGKRGTYKGKKIHEAGKWGLLGGFFNRDETLIECLKREVMEESGWIIENIKLFRINDSPLRPKEENRQNVDIIFIANAIVQSGGSDEEVTDLEWFDLASIPMDQIAFDHGDSIELYKKYISDRFSLPLLGKIDI